MAEIVAPPEAAPIVLKGEGEIKIVKRRAYRIPCARCGEDAVRRHTYLLANARSNPASSAYRKDDCSWCSDHEEFTCLECFADNRHPSVQDYEWCSTFSANDRFAHMFLKWKEEPAGGIAAAAPDLLSAARNYIEIFDRCGGSEAVSAEEFASARAELRDAIAEAKE